MQANISEIFFSIQGEGPLVGLPFLFVRFSECNLKCNYCDTKWNWKKTEYCRVSEKKLIPNPITLSTFFDILRNFNFQYISFTGGEPLLHYNFIERSFLHLHNKKILIETNGTLPLYITEKLIERIDFWSVDIKLPSLVNSNYFELHKKFIERLSDSKGKIIIKIVFSKKTTEQELIDAFKLITPFEGKDTSVIFQPLTEGRKIRMNERLLSTIYKIMVESKLDIRIIPQIHKILRLK